MNNNEIKFKESLHKDAPLIDIDIWSISCKYVHFSSSFPTNISYMVSKIKCGVKFYSHLHLLLFLIC